VNGGVTLTLWNLVVKFSQTGDLQHVLSVGGTLVVRLGGLQSNDTFHWQLTSTGRVDLEHTNVSDAGSGATAGMDILGGSNNIVSYSRISGSRVRMLGGRNDYFGYNNFSAYDDSATGNNGVLWLGSNSTLEHNSFWDVTVGTQALIFIFENWGNINIFANDFKYRANGSNAMGVEVRDMSPDFISVKPTGYLVTETWNNLTITYWGGGTNDIPFDNEYSERLYIAYNHVSGLTDGCLQGGGLTNSLMERNVCKGSGIGGSFGIYDYIYDNAHNVFRNNTFDNYENGLEFQTGNIIVTDNTFTNLTGTGVYICPNAPCAGSTANTSNNAWYNNTFTFTSGGYLTHMSPSNAFYNTFLGHGASAWTDGTNSHPVNGDWLFFANGPVTHVEFADRSDGHRTLKLTSGGRTYWDQESLPGVTDDASLAVDGTLDNQGSVYGSTVLKALEPDGSTSLDVVGTGATTFTVRGFAANYTYNMSLRNRSTGVYRNGTLSTDASGFAQQSVDFGASLTGYSVVFWGSFPTPPTDTTPPNSITDLRATATGARYVVLQWTAPGNNGTVGRASQYDLRYSTSGPLNDTTFGQATQVPISAPGLSGSTETFNLTGLSPGTSYWIALRTADSVPNWSPVSNDVDVATASLPRPAVLFASLNPSGTSIEIAFSSPMNRSSVEGAIAFSDPIVYHVVWADDRHLQVVLDESLVPGVQYRLTLSTSAADQDGLALGAPFTYTFTAPEPTPMTGASGDVWVGLATALGGSIIVLLLVIFQDRVVADVGRGIRRLRRSDRRPPKRPPRPPKNPEAKPPRD
jgi:hypothetical protein